jgi:PAS domain S-box-containing protein
MTNGRFQIQSVFFYFAAQPAWLRYGLALITVIAATTATLYIPLIGERAAFLLFFFGIAQASFWLGLKPGVLTAVLSLIAVNAFVLFPIGTELHKILILNAGFCFVSAVMLVTTSFNRQLAEALKESRQNLNHAQNVGKIGSWRMNVQHNQLQWSEQNYRIFEIPQDTPMTYETFLDAVHPKDRDYVDKMWQAALNGESYDIEHRIVIAGQVKWVREKASLEFDKKGKLLGGFGITQDITERKHNELALIESWQQYAGIVESSMDAIVTLDEDQHILLFNNAAAKMFGHSGNEVVGLSIERFIPVGFPPDQWGSMKANIPTGNQDSKTEKRIAVKALRASGEEFSVEASISQRVVAGKLCYTLILRDVTERMRTEFAINERLRLQDQLTKVAATVPGVICSFRLRPDGSASMPYASPIFQSLYGIDHDTVIDDFGPVFARTHPDDISHIHDTVAESARTLQPWRDAFRYNHPTKGEIWIEGHSMPQREADGSILWHGYVQDVTERKQVELERQKFVSLADNSQEFIGMCDMNFTSFYVNAAGMRLVGLDSLEQACQTAFQEFFFPEDQRFIIEEFFPRLPKEQCGNVEIRFRHFKTGAAIWMIYNVFCIKNNQGDPVGFATVSRDISARKRAEDALKKSQDQLRLFVDQAPISIAMFDRNMNYIVTSRRWIDDFGRGYNELIGRNHYDIHMDLPAEWKQNHRKAQAGEFLKNDEDLWIQSDGSQLWLRWAVYPWTNQEGEIGGIIISAENMTAYHQAEAAVRASEAFVSNLLNSLPEHVAVLDNHGKVMAVNEPWKRFALENNGNPKDVCVGANYLEVCRQASKVGEPYALKALAGLEAILAGRQDEFAMEYPCHTPANNRWFLMNAKRMSHDSEGIVITHLDITEHKQAQDELRESEARLALIIEEAKAGYWDWNPLTSELFLSSESKRQIGFEDNLLNCWEEWESRLHPDDRAMVWVAAKNYISGQQQNYDLEFRLKHKDGSYRWIHSRGGLLRDQNNRPSRMLGISLDVTDYKKQKEINERRVELEQSFRLHVAVQTAAAIAHELNQPLTAICSYADVATHILQTGNSNPEKLSQIMENCSLQAQRAGKVIRQLLTLLQKGETTSEAMDINNSVHKAIEIVKADGLVDVFKIEMNLTADLPPVMANALQVQKVLINLVRNGLESMQIRGKDARILTVTTRPFDVDPAMVLVTVSDSGVGVVDTATLKKIFQPFYTTKTTGLGMGLAISRALIEAHGGKLWAEQNADIGISIHFTLPFEG